MCGCDGGRASAEASAGERLREGGDVPVEKVCKSLHMFKSLHMALVGHVTRTRGPLPSKNSPLSFTALKLLPKRIPGTHPANLI